MALNNLVILVEKSAHTLTLLLNGAPVKTYHVELGGGGLADKEVEGDQRTPEGEFYVMNKRTISPPSPTLGSRWLGVSYPSPEDASRGVIDGVIDETTYESIVDAFASGGTPPQNTALGGQIGIHGGSSAAWGKDWTWGCVGLTNEDIEDFYDQAEVGTKIIIRA